jgi:hypothetical protein
MVKPVKLQDAIGVFAAPKRSMIGYGSEGT